MILFWSWHLENTIDLDDTIFFPVHYQLHEKEYKYPKLQKRRSGERWTADKWLSTLTHSLRKIALKKFMRYCFRLKRMRIFGKLILNGKIEKVEEFYPF